MSGNTPQQPRRNYLADIKTSVQRRPLAAVFYGPPGIGKTTLGAHAPSPVFVTDPKEDGITTLKSYGRVPASIPQITAANWSETLAILDSLAQDEHTYRTLVLDSMAGFERLCHNHVVAQDFFGDWGDKGFMSFHKGYTVSLPYWMEFLNALDAVRDRGMSVILLAHSMVKTVKNPAGEDYDHFIPDVHEKTWQITHKWADFVGCMQYVVAVDNDGKAHGGQQRLMMTEFHPAYEAKNRMGLPAEIDMGTSGQEAWNNLASALKACIAKDGGSNG